MSAAHHQISATADERADAFGALDRFVVARPGDPAVWTLAPLLRALYKDRALLDQFDGRLRRRRVARQVDHHVRAALASPTAAEHLVVDEVLFVIGTSRHRWVLEPLVDAAPSGAEPVRLVTRRLASRGVAGGVRHGIRLADAMADAFAHDGVPSSMPVAELYGTWLATHRYLAASDRMLTRARPRAVVIATNHNVPSRAMAHAAREHGIPVVYVPHAPMIMDERFSDIPADHAGMRGEAEVERLVALGADSDRLAVVGDPSLDALDVPPIDPDGPVAFALPSVLTDDQVRMTVEWIRVAAGDAVVVSPHPRQGEAYARRFAPAGWQTWHDRTIGLLRQGPPVVVQMSSGVAVEAMLLGLPTLQIDLPGHPPNYPALDPAHVPFVGTADDVVAAVSEARATSTESARREAVVTWARRWSAHQGPEASRRVWTVIERAVAEGPGAGFLNDAWGSRLRDSAHVV